MRGIRGVSAALLGLAVVGLAPPGTVAGGDGGEPVFEETFTGCHVPNHCLDPVHWLRGFRNFDNPPVWGIPPLGGVVTQEEGEARMAGTPSTNALLALSTVSVQDRIVTWRAKYSGAYDFAYWAVLSTQLLVPLTTSYEEILDFGNYFGGDRIGRTYRNYTLVVADGGADIRLYQDTRLLDQASLPGAQWLIFVAGNEARTLHLDDVRVYEGAG